MKRKTYICFFRKKLDALSNNEEISCVQPFKLVEIRFSQYKDTVFELGDRVLF